MSLFAADFVSRFSLSKTFQKEGFCMQEMWFYKNEKGERARLVNSGGVILAFVGRDQCRFPSVKTAQTQLSMWGYRPCLGSPSGVIASPSLEK